MTDFNILLQNKADRRSKYYYRWRRDVLKKYNNVCQKCFNSKANIININNKNHIVIELSAHHIKDFFSNPKERFDINNGICLCTECHIEFHRIYGLKNNEKQLLEYISIESDI